MEIHNLPLHSGIYSISIYLGDDNCHYDEKIDYLTFELISKKEIVNNFNLTDMGPMQIDAKWYLEVL